MAPTKLASNAKAASAGGTSARSYRRQPVEIKLEAGGAAGFDDDTVAHDHDHDDNEQPVIDPRENDFSERSWWMVDVEGVGSDRCTQGATVLVKRCMRAYGWDLPKARKILKAYKQFLSLKKTLGDWDATLLSPCHLVDQMWHQHLLDNFNYYHDMLLLCGHFVGHNPDGALDVEGKIRRDRFTRECLRQHFGDSYDTEVWGTFGDEILSIRAARNPNEEQHGVRDGEQRIDIIVKDQTGEETTFTIGRTTRMSKLFKVFSARKGVCVKSLKFMLDGEDIDPDATPVTLELEDNYQIDAMLNQNGC